MSPAKQTYRVTLHLVERRGGGYAVEVRGPDYQSLRRSLVVRDSGRNEVPATVVLESRP